MATLRPIRTGVVILGLLALAPVVVSMCSSGGPQPAVGSVTLVGDDPACYSEADIDSNSVPLPKPADLRQYIYAHFTKVPTPKQRRDLEPDVLFLDSLGKGAFSIRINRDAWDASLQELVKLDADCLANLSDNNRASPKLLGDRTVLRGYDTTGPTIQITVYVRFWSDVPLSEQKTILTGVGVANVDSIETFNDEWLVTLPDTNLGDLIANGQVQWVEELDPEPDDDLDETRSAIGIPPNFANDGDGTVIAQWEICHPANKAPDEHPDIANRASTGLGQKLCTPTGTPNLLPSNAHATQVAGILVGDGSASAVGGGTAGQWRGMAPKASVVSYSVHSLDSAGLIDEYLDATQSMAVISTNSWGSKFDDYYHRPHSSLYAFRSALFDTVSSRRNAAGDPAGPGQRMLVVASSGNRGGDRVDPGDTNSDRIYWSTARIRNSAKNVLTVGNVTSGPDGNIGKPAFDTGRGPTKDGRLKPDLVAPGSQYVQPLGPDPGVMSPVYPPATANASTLYAPGWGTSFSTPVVAGAAALLTTTIRTGTCNRNPTPAELRALLVHTAEDLVDASDDAEFPSLTQNYTLGEYDLAKLEEIYFNLSAPGFAPTVPYTVTDPPAGVDALVGPDYVFGYGMVQPARADTLATNGNFLRASITHGYVEFPIVVREADLDDGILRVTLAWDDPPATRKQKSETGLEVSLLQNDLDLVVVAPDGTRHIPWTLDPTQPEKPAVQESYGQFEFWPEEAGDHRNTIEQVAIEPDTAQLGQTWRIQVWGMDLLLPPQEFALAAEIIQPATPCADIPINIEPDPVVPPRDWTYWVLFVIAVVVLLLLLLWLAELIYNAYLHKGQREAILRVLIAFFVLALIAVLLFNWFSGPPPDPV